MLAQTLSAAENPWCDLKHYEENQAAFFFARDAEIEQLDRLLAREPLAVLYGVSGLGKTSLLLAGLFPRLRERHCFPLILRLGLADPDRSLTVPLLVALCEAGRERGYEVPEPQEGDTLWKYFHRRGNRIWDAAVRPKTPVLVLDQLEEIFVTHHWTPAKTDSHLTAFFEELGQLVENRPPPMAAAEREGYDCNSVPMHVVLAIREDFLAPLATLRRYFPTLRRAELRLLRFGKRQADEVVCGRDGQLEQYTAPDARQETLAAVRASQKDEAAASGDSEETFNPAILSLFLHRLCRAAQEEGSTVITADLVKSKGDQILETFYDEALGAVPPAERTQTEHFIEDELIAGAIKLFRDRAPVQRALERGVSHASLKALSQARLIVTEGALEDETTLIELTHDCLCDIAGSRRDKRRKVEALKATAKKVRRLVRLGLILTLSALLLIAIGMTVFAFKKLWETERVNAELKTEKRRTEKLYADLQESRAADKLVYSNDHLNEAKSQLDRIKQSGYADPVVTRQQLESFLKTFEESKKQVEEIAAEKHLSADIAAGIETQRALLTDLESRQKSIVTEAETEWQQTPTPSPGPLLSAPELATVHRQSSILLQHDGPVNWLAFAPGVLPNGQRLIATASGDKQVRLWNNQGALIRQRSGSTDAVNMVAFSPDSHFLASASNGSTVRYYDLLTDAASAFERQADSITCVDFLRSSDSPAYPAESNFLAAASADRTVYVYNGRLGKVAYYSSPRLPSIPTFVQFSPKTGKLLVSSADDGKVRLHFWTTRAPVWTLEGLTAPARRATFSYDGRWVTACSDAGEVAVWSVDQSQPKPILLHLGADGKPVPVFHAVFSPQPIEGRLCVAAGGGDGVVRLWDFQTEAKAVEGRAHRAAVRFVAWSHDAKWLVTGDSNGEAVVWAAKSGSFVPRIRLNGHNKVIRQVVFSPDDRQLATCSDDGAALLWPAALWEPQAGPDH
jgi:WD40 repeat protein